MCCEPIKWNNFLPVGRLLVNCLEGSQSDTNTLDQVLLFNQNRKGMSYIRISRNSSASLQDSLVRLFLLCMEAFYLEKLLEIIFKHNLFYFLYSSMWYYFRWKRIRTFQCGVFYNVFWELRRRDSKWIAMNCCTYCSGMNTTLLKYNIFFCHGPSTLVLWEVISRDHEQHNVDYISLIKEAFS